VSGIKPLNDQQVMAVDALLDPEVALVTLTGQAGTGKTLLAIAAGLEQNYSRILVSKPTVPMGRDIGFLPGNEREKMDVWVQPIYDNIELISSFQREPLEEIMEQLSVTALTFMRGRSIPNQFIIVDEAQNLSPHEVKTIVTRVGENSKLVFTGDIEQIDSPYLDKESNGLTYLINKFKKEPIAAHVNLIQGERSELASLGAKLL
jgi:PhoH-like ATPase